jgi:hypothetical protein
MTEDKTANVNNRPKCVNPNNVSLLLVRNILGHVDHPVWNYTHLKKRRIGLESKKKKQM